jgi:hypothetical protein
MRKRNNNGDRFRKKKINLMHISGNRKWQPYLQYVHDLIYAEDIRGNWAFLEECLIPSNIEVLDYFPQRFLFRGKAVVRVFYEKKLPEELADVIRRKCLEYA